MNLNIARVALLTIWVISLVFSVVITHEFIEGKTKVQGRHHLYYRVQPSERDNVWIQTTKSIGAFYTAYLGGMLIFIFSPRWKTTNGTGDVTRFVIAEIMTLLFNGLFLALLCRPFFDITNHLAIEDAAKTAATVTSTFSFVLTAIMAFYFEMNKPKDSRKDDKGPANIEPSIDNG
jgi:hypothetical protein